MLKKLFYKITGGRPMIKIGYYFTDSVSNEAVNLFIDKHNNYWMANGKWSSFRVPIERSRVLAHLKYYNTPTCN